MMMDNAGTASQRGLGDIKSIDIPIQIPNLKAQQISSVSSYTLLIDLNNNVWSFGDNEFGQLGLGDNDFRNIPTQIHNFKAQKI